MPSNLIYVGTDAFNASVENSNQSSYTNPLQIPAGAQIGNAGFSVSPTHGLLGSFAGTALLGANGKIVGSGDPGNIEGTTDKHYSSISATNTKPTDTIFFGPQLFANNQSITSVDLSGSNIQSLEFGIGNNLGANSMSNILGTFANATKLTDITLPATCSQFGMTTSYYSSPFARCTSLANIKYNGFTLNTKPAEGTTDAPTGFAALSEDT